jgi:hypothetical protein
MNKRIILVVIFILFAINCYSLIVKPDKKKETGAIIGKIELYFDENWSEIKADKKFYKMRIYFKNKFTGRTYSVSSDDKGLFYSLNLPAGYYVFTSCDFYVEETTMHYWINGVSIGKDGVTVSVHKNTISTFESIVLKIKLTSNNWMHSYLERRDEIELVKSLFNEKDTSGYWKDYEWGDFEIED